MTTLDPNRDLDEIDIDLRLLGQVWRANRRLLHLVTAVAAIAVTSVQLWQYASGPVKRRSVQAVRFVLDANQMRDGHMFRTAEVIASSVVERAYASLGQPPAVPVGDVEAHLSMPAVNSAAGEYALVYEAVPPQVLPDVSVSRLLRAVIEVWQRDRVVERVGRQLPDRWVFAPAGADSPFVRADQLRTQLADWSERMKALEERFSTELVAPPQTRSEFRALREQLANGLAQRLLPAMMSVCRSGGLTVADANYLKVRRAELTASVDEQHARIAAARSLIEAVSNVPPTPVGGADAVGAGTAPGTRGNTTPVEGGRDAAAAKLLQQAGADLLSASYAEARLRRENAIYDVVGCGKPAPRPRPVDSSLVTVVDEIEQLALRLDEKARALAGMATLEGLDYVLGDYSSTERKTESLLEVAAWTLLTLILTPAIVFAGVLIRHLRRLPINR